MDIIKTAKELNKKLNDRKIVVLGGNCEYKKCYHCGLAISEVNNTTIEKFKTDIRKIDSKKVNTICIYTPGSFFKFSPKFREAVLNEISKTNINRIIIESRSQLVTPNNIKQLKEILGNKEIEIGVGFDHKNRIYRNVYLNKGISLNEYKKCAKLLKNFDIKLITYIAIGCPFLTEREAISSAIESSLYAIGNGTDIISLEPLEIQEGTIQDMLYKRGEFNPPFLWSIAEVIKKIHNSAKKHKVKIRIGGVVQAPIPYANPHNNCDICDNDGRFKIAFDKYERTQDIDIIKKLNCVCKRDWLDNLNKRLISKRFIKDRLENFNHILLRRRK